MPALARAVRLATFGAAAAGIVGCAYHLWLIWSRPGDSALLDFTRATGSIGSALLLGVALLIAWLGADHPPNLALALAIAVIFAGAPLSELQYEGVLSGDSMAPLSWLMFLLGAGFFIRAAQLFPEPLRTADIAASPALAGRLAFLRRFLSVLLRPTWTWAYAVLLTGIALFAPYPSLREAARLGVIVSGVLFFYISFRSGKPDSVRRVLWFLAAALLSLILGVVRLAIGATVGPGLTPDGRLLIGIVLFTLEQLILVVGILGAVFYVGAISPALVIRKTMIYGVTAGSLLFTLATLQAVIADVLVDLFGVTDRLVGAFMGTLFGLAFAPLRRRVEDLLKRFDWRAAAKAPLPGPDPIVVESPAGTSGSA